MWMGAVTSGPLPRPFNVSRDNILLAAGLKRSLRPEAQETIMILDWWLSPEVYLRRAPALNEQYRLDVMLKAAAERGVVINIIVYKEVDAALTLNSKVSPYIDTLRLSSPCTQWPC